MSVKLLSKDFAFYGLLDFVQRSLAILLVPVYTRVLTQTSYGNLDLIITVCGIVTVLIDLQFIAGFARLYLENRAAGEGPQFAGTTILARVCLGLAFVTVFVAAGNAGLLELSFLPSFLLHRAPWTIAVATIPVVFAYDVLIMQAQMLRVKTLYFIAAVGNTLVAIVSSIVLIVYADWGLTGVVTGQLAGMAFGTLVLLAGLRHEIRFDLRRAYLGALASYSLPLVPGRWLGQVTAYVNRFFVYGVFGASENAILAITTKLMATVGIFCVAFRTAWQPLAMSYIGQTSGDQFYVRSMRLLAAGGLFSVAAVMLAARPGLILLVPPAYRIAELYLPSFLLATVIGELDVNLQLGNQIAKTTHWISAAAGVAFMINLGVLALFTSRIGIHAAGFALLLSMVARALITFATAQRSHAIRYDRRAFAVFALSAGTLVILSIVRSLDAIPDVGFYAATLVVGLMGPWAIMHAEERQVVRTLVRDLVARVHALSARGPS